MVSVNCLLFTTVVVVGLHYQSVSGVLAVA